MVDGKPTRSVLTAPCQGVGMRLGGIAQSAQKTHQRASVKSRTGPAAIGAGPCGFRFICGGRNLPCSYLYEAQRR